MTQVDFENRPGGGAARVPVGRRHARRRAGLAVIAVLTVILASGCGGGGKSHGASATQSRPTTALPGTFAITIDNSRYSHLNVPPGKMVKVVNKDDVEHTVTSDTPGLFNVRVAPHTEQVFTSPMTPGTYPYHCADDPAMHGELVVYQ